MFKKFFLFTVMAVVMVMEMPFAASAATTAKSASLNASLTKPQIRIQLGTRRHRRYRRYRGDNYQYRQTGRYVMVPQYYWWNGQRRVRYVRTYRNF